MFAELRELIRYFSRADQLRLVGFAFAQFFASLGDLVGLAVVLPLMQVLLGSGLDTGYIGILHAALQQPTREQFVLIMLAMMVCAFSFKAATNLLLQWWSTGLLTRLQVANSTRLLRTYLGHDYLTHRKRNTAEAITTVGGAVPDAHYRALGGLLSLLSSGLSVLLILALLLAVAPLITLIALSYFGLVVFTMQRLLAGPNLRAGRDALAATRQRDLALLNTMHGFREVKMHQVEAEFIAAFHTANQGFGLASRRVNFYAQIPKYGLELAGIIGIALGLIVTLLLDNPQSMMPTLTLFVAATVRLLPLMAALTTTLGIIRSGRKGLQTTLAALRSTLEPVPEPQPLAAPATQLAPASIELDQVSFQYPDGKREVLQDIDLTIPAGSSLALCGSSGSGKTTLVDIMLGLIPIETGKISYGDRPISDLGPRWHEVVAYVPQDVFLLNQSLAANIAFGQPETEWDTARIERALQLAQLTEVVAELPEGINSLLGERGARVSGGQRQRIGIARALYRDPQVVVFDEATSALDNETEDQISRTIRDLSGQITTVIVAHRLSTVRHVDQLVYLEQGRINAIGSFDQVRQTSPAFARMVKLGRLDYS